MENANRESVRLHLGAGDKYWPGGWVNVDVSGDQDVLSDIKSLDYPDSSVDEIQNIHVFEHFNRKEAIAALKEWRRVLKDGGKLVMEMPCLDKVASLIALGEKNLRLTLFALYGDPARPEPEMQHKWCWSVDEITKQLLFSGFVDVKIEQPIFHVRERDMRVIATKGDCLCQ